MQAVWEVARPVAFSVLIIAIVLVPLFTLQGIEGKMFMPLALTMIFAMLVSLIVALTIVPVISEMFLKQIEEKEFGFVRRFHHGYLNLLATARRKIKVTLAISLIALIAAGLVATTIGTEFIPTLDEGAIAINVVRLPNASLDGSKDVSTFMEKRILANSRRLVLW